MQQGFTSPLGLIAECIQGKTQNDFGILLMSMLLYIQKKKAGLAGFLL
jgi:hypothetical protein